MSSSGSSRDLVYDACHNRQPPKRATASVLDTGTPDALDGSPNSDTLESSAGDGHWLDAERSHEEARRQADHRRA